MCVLRVCLDTCHGPRFCFPVLYLEIGKEAHDCHAYIYKAVKGGVAYPPAVSNLCIRDKIQMFVGSVRATQPAHIALGGPREPVCCCLHILSA